MIPRLKNRIEVIFGHNQENDDHEVEVVAETSSAYHVAVNNNEDDVAAADDGIPGQQQQSIVNNEKDVAADDDMREQEQNMEGKLGEEVEMEIEDVEKKSHETIDQNTDEENMKDASRTICPSGSRRRRIFALLFVLLPAIVASIFITITVKVEQRKQLEEQPPRACVEYEVADLNENRLELSLSGLTRPTTAEEQAYVEQVVVDAYNEVSDQCRDIFERWMVHANMVNQTLLIASGEDYDYDYGFSEERSYVVADIELEISCVDCPEEEEFATIYPDISRRFIQTKRKGYQLVKGDPNPGSIRMLVDTTTIHSSQVIDLIESKLLDASSAESIEDTFTHVSDAYTRSSGGGGKKAGGKGKTSKSSKSSSDDCGKGKGKTGSTTKSSTGSTTKGSTKGSTESSTSKSKGSSKDKACSPSVSLEPSFSAEPSISVEPSMEPSTSLEPSLSAEPSVSNQPSISNQPTITCPCFTAQRLLEVAPLDGSLTYNQIESCNTNINGQRSNVRIVVEGSGTPPAQIRRGRGGSSPSDAEGRVDCFARDQTGPTPAPVLLGVLPDSTVEAQIEACNELLFDHCQLLRDNNLIADSFDMCTVEDFDRLIIAADPQPTDCLYRPVPPECCWDNTILDSLFPTSAPAMYDATSCLPNSNGQRANIRIVRTDISGVDVQMQRGRNAAAGGRDESGVITCRAPGPAPVGPLVAFLGDIDDEPSIAPEVDGCNDLLFTKCEALRAASLISADFDDCDTSDEYDKLILDGLTENQVCIAPAPLPPP